jgi:hypothetical protein
MKHSKALFLSIVLVNVAISLKAQSYQETIQWINSKIRAYGSRDVYYQCSVADDGSKYYFPEYWAKTADQLAGVDESVDNSKGFTIKRCVTLEGRSNCTLYTGDVIPYSDITAVKMTEPDCSGNVWLTISGDFKTLYNDQTRSIHEQYVVSLGLPWQVEANLLDRMNKAFLHIIELNSHGETF